jgi:hypothetical protein
MKKINFTIMLLCGILLSCDTTEKKSIDDIIPNIKKERR